MNKKHLFLLRHCQSLYNIQGKITGQTDCPVINEFIDYSSLEEILLTDNVIIISSPLSRCLDTARLLQQSVPRKWSIRTEELIIERGMGKWEGIEKTIILKQFPQYFHNDKFISKLTPIGGGETYINFKNRVLLFVHTIEKILKENHVIICSHNQTLRMITSILTDNDYDTISSYQNGIVIKLF